MSACLIIAFLFFVLRAPAHDRENFAAGQVQE